MSQFIEPKNWQNVWEKERVAFLQSLMFDISYAFNERDYDAAFYLVYRRNNAYISLSIRPQASVKSSTRSFLGAFGFFYDHAKRWPDYYIDDMADRAIEEYQRFERGEWPINAIHDQDVIDRVTHTEEDPLS